MLHGFKFAQAQLSGTKLEEIVTHKSAKTHVGNDFVTRDLDLWPQSKWIQGLVVEHFYDKSDASFF